jgi:hypothetical protein
MAQTLTPGLGRPELPRAWQRYGLRPERLPRIEAKNQSGYDEVVGKTLRRVIRIIPKVFIIEAKVRLIGQKVRE